MSIHCKSCQYESLITLHNTYDFKTPIYYPLFCRDLTRPGLKLGRPELRWVERWERSTNLCGGGQGVWVGCGVGVGFSGPPNPGVQPPYPTHFFLPNPSPFSPLSPYFIFGYYPPPKIQTPPPPPPPHTHTHTEAGKVWRYVYTILKEVIKYNIDWLHLQLWAYTTIP